MAAAFSCFRDFNFPFAVLLPLFLCVTSSSSDVPMSSYPLPGIRSTHFHALSEREIQDTPWTHADVRLPDPDSYSERLDLALLQSATSWIEIHWQLVNSTGSKAGSTRFSRVRCHIGNTTILHNFFGPANQFRIPNLSSNTEYMVCVEVMESTSNYLHFKCARFGTIPLVRPDSIMGLFLAVGYFALLIFTGFVTWKVRVRKHVASHKAENDMELSARNSTVRFSEIEEHAHLNSNRPELETNDIS
ncbi:uncharacterized protein [Littorina saxatilis]|uniref:uncharacterized protein n=1 Tax=Littorina saxatilis TaxID=31220 RepID=UPI0038B52D60